MFTRLPTWTSSFHSDSYRWNGNIRGRLHGGYRRDCDYLQDVVELRRGFAVLTPEIFRPLYLALVRPILEYGQQASSPYLQRDIALMERIQRLATRMAKTIREFSYEERLRRLPFRKRSFSRPQQNGTYEDITSRFVIVVSVCSGGKQPTP